MPKNLLLWTTQTPANRAALRLEFVRFFRLKHWLIYLIGVPLIVAVALLTIFFFAASLGLFAAVLAIAALRVLWLRLKLRHSTSPEAFEDRHVKRAKVVREETDKGARHVYSEQGSRT